MAKHLLMIIAIGGLAVLGLSAIASYSWISATGLFNTRHFPFNSRFLQIYSTVHPITNGAFRNTRSAVYFLKAHKCASTTVQRLLMIRAMKHNLSVALPRDRGNVFYPELYQPAIIKRTCSYPHFDIMAAHARYHPSARTFLPRDAFFLSIVRDPAEQMESSYYYFLVKQCNFSSAGLSFERYMNELIRDRPKRRLPPIEYPCDIEDMRFIQLHDFGFDIDSTPTKAIVQRKIEELDSDFHLVLIAERLDEGLIIMRDMLGWSTEDLLYLKSNFRPHATSNLSAETRAAAYAWNWGDSMLYDHFRSKMDAMIEQRKEYLRTEVRKFHDMQAAFYNNCVTGVVGDAEKHVYNQEAQKLIVITSYVLSERGRANSHCRLAALTELELFKLMNNRYPICNTAAA